MKKEAAGIRFQSEDDEPQMENLMHQVSVQTLKAEHKKQSRKKATGIDAPVQLKASGRNCQHLLLRGKGFWPC